jgi:hypothetical protein
MKILINIPSLMVLIGALMKIMLYPNANSLLMWGFILTTAFSALEISGLKKIITQIERFRSID